MIRFRKTTLVAAFGVDGCPVPSTLKAYDIETMSKWDQEYVEGQSVWNMLCVAEQPYFLDAVVQAREYHAQAANVDSESVYASVWIKGLGILDLPIGWDGYGNGGRSASAFNSISRFDAAIAYEQEARREALVQLYFDAKNPSRVANLKRGCAAIVARGRKIEHGVSTDSLVLVETRFGVRARLNGELADTSNLNVLVDDSKRIRVESGAALFGLPPIDWSKYPVTFCGTSGTNSASLDCRKPSTFTEREDFFPELPTIDTTALSASITRVDQMLAEVARA